MAEIDGFDLDRSTAQAWAEFQGRLAEVVSMMDDSGDLTIGTDTGAAERGPYVRFSSPGRDTVRVEAASNAELGEHFQLSPDDLAAMEDMGWQPPQVAMDPTSGPRCRRRTATRWPSWPSRPSGTCTACSTPCFSLPTSWPRCSTRRHRSRDPDAGWSEPRSRHRSSSAASFPVTAST